jgi:hypothetical protein
MGSEKTFKDQVAKTLRKMGCYVLLNHSIYRSGVPDLSVVTKGRSVWLELKYDKGDSRSLKLSHGLSAPQSKTLREIGESGAFVGVLVGFGDGKCGFFDAKNLEPGPKKEFEFAPDELMTVEDMMQWILDSAVASVS